jgi:hypothetical protein
MSKFTRVAWTWVLAFGLTAVFLHGQTSEEEQVIENVEEGDASGWIDRLETVRTDPLDVNRASLEELTAFPLIPPLFAKQIVENRKDRGPFQSWADLVARTGLGVSYASALEPYFVLSKPKERTPLMVEVRMRLIRDFPEPEGYGNGTYTGDPLHSTLRAKVRSGDGFSAGFLMEKDPGESRWNDHAVGFVSFQNKNGKNRAILGNFLVEAGQGLVLASPYPSLKGADPVAPLESRPLGEKGYLYASEGRAFRGVLFQRRLRLVHCTVFFSKTGMDGSTNPDGSIKSAACTGYHRTASEMTRRNAFSETLAGLRVETYTRFAAAGFTGFMSRFSKPVFHEETELYRFDFSGSENASAGCDWNAAWKNLNWSGEAALSRSGGTAFLSTLIVDSKPIGAVLSFRRYDPSYDNPHASGFAACETQNETGLYAGFTAKPFRHTKAGMYVDAFRRPWRTYSNPVPVRGEDLFLRIDRTFPRLFSVSARLRIRLAEKMAASDPGGTAALRERQDRQFRLDFRCKPFNGAESTTRFNWVRVRYPATADPAAVPEKGETGFLVCESLRIRPRRDVQAAVAGTVFGTDSYDSRVTLYENDLDGMFSLPMFYGRGVKWHAVVKWNISYRTEFSASFGHVIHNGVSFWGSGPERTAGNAENRLAIQLDRAF